MSVLLGTFVAMACFIVLMSVGVLFGRKPILFRDPAAGLTRLTAWTSVSCAAAVFKNVTSLALRTRLLRQ